MAVIRRRMDGPQDFHEQRDGIAYRDTRTLSARLIEALRTEASALPLIAAAGIALAVPAVTTALVPVALAYTGYVLSRPLELPLRLPGFARRKDYGNPVPDPKRPGVDIPGRAQGDWLLGWDEVTGQQIWVSGDDLTMHGILPGATGAGKTQLIYSLLCSAVAQGTGFTLIDGKASNELVFTLEAVQRKWGAHINMRVINFLVANGDRKSHTWNPFASVNAEGMAELLRTLFLPDNKGGGGNSEHFRSRADSLIGSMTKVFVWMRDNIGIPITVATMRINFSDIQTLIDLVRRQEDSNADRQFAYYSMETGETVRIPLPGNFPEEILQSVRFYVQETGGYSETKGSAEGQDKVREQHSYVIGGFAKTFTMMTSTYGHIFNCEVPDVDMQDVIFNRRNLVVLLPSLENDRETNAAIGKTVITAQRYALAAALGTSIEGDYTDLVENRPSMATTPYLLINDEVNYFATLGTDVMMAQARSLNISIFLSFQEIGSLYATLGRDNATPLLGNPKLKIFQNIEDATVTREWVEQTGGTMQVGVLSGYDNSPLIGAYSDQLRADIREVKRISWSDIQGLRRGQAIILFRGKRIYTRLFNGGIKPEGRNRLYSPLRIRNQRATAPASITTTAPGASRVSEALAAGADLVEDRDFQRLDGVLGEVYNRLAAIISNDTATRDDVSNLFGLPLPEAPFRPFEALFRDLPAPHPLAAQSRDSLVDRRVNRELYETMVAFEMKMGAPEANARNQIARMLNQTLHAEI